MNKNRYGQAQFIGFRLNKNIYNRSGVLILPSLTVLTRNNMEMLVHQNITLDYDDVEHVSILHLVNSAVQEIKSVFEKVRKSKIIPIEDVIEKIIPSIVEMSQRPDLKHIMTHLEQHDEYTYRHSIGVALISRLIGKAKGLPAHELLELTTAGFLHDIGKMMVPEEILNNPGKLTDEEFVLIKNHTMYGFEIIKNTPGILHRHAIIALQHHEREDGSGYPYGLTGVDIDPYSKIVAVADVFHAMISKRVYKSSIPFYEVLNEMTKEMYGRLEPCTTLCFIKRMMDLLIGNYVRLSNGMEGKIIMVKPDDPIHPVVEVNGKYIDLSRQKSIYLQCLV